MSKIPQAMSEPAAPGPSLTLALARFFYKEIDVRAERETLRELLQRVAGNVVRSRVPLLFTNSTKELAVSVLDDFLEVRFAPNDPSAFQAQDAVDALSQVHQIVLRRSEVFVPTVTGTSVRLIGSWSMGDDSYLLSTLRNQLTRSLGDPPLVPDVEGARLRIGFSRSGVTRELDIGTRAVTPHAIYAELGSTMTESMAEGEFRGHVQGDCEFLFRTLSEVIARLRIAPPSSTGSAAGPPNPSRTTQSSQPGEQGPADKGWFKGRRKR